MLHVFSQYRFFRATWRLRHDVVRGPTCDVFVSELDVDDVVAWLSGRVFDLTRAVRVIFTLNIRLARSFHRQTQTTQS